MGESRYGLMWSGGKDSALALRRAGSAGVEVAALLTFFDAATGRIRFHATRQELIEAQASAVGLPLRAVATSWAGFDGAFRAELGALRQAGFKGVVFGDIHLADVRAWYQSRVEAEGLVHVEPIWGERPAALLEEFVTGGGRAVVTCVDLRVLDGSWLGRVVDQQFCTDVALSGIDPCGENGEFHTFAFAGPPFAGRVAWSLGDRREENGFAQVDLLLQPPSS